MNAFPLNFGPEGAGGGIFYWTASGEWILDGGAWQFQGYDENGLLRSLSGRLTGFHKVLCSAADIACNGRQDFYLGHDCGYMIPMRTHFELLVNWHGKNELIPVYLENNKFQFLPEPRSEIHRDEQCEQCSAVGKRVRQSSALVSPTETLNRDVASMMTSNQLGNLVQMSKWKMMKIKNPWKQKFTESE